MLDVRREAFGLPRTNEVGKMGIENVVKVIKEIHPEKLILIKIGNFYNSYGKDLYIISYLFNYQLRDTDKIISCGFPKGALNKILKTIEDREISYIIVNKSNNYEEEDKIDFKKKNMYLETYNKAHKYLSKKRKIDNIYNYLLENIDDKNIKEKINKVEKILYEI